ncbi:hypothetical protein [Nocardioides sp. Leaf285]|uniref:hypothetical protein n=1 Tax=Nocardioides sp. Leaf285 TaxID=1736322 RepID=UPI0012EAA0A6|nr:hypothetical protein [Nocardioides sp. Leaf285]
MPAPLRRTTTGPAASAGASRRSVLTGLAGAAVVLPAVGGCSGGEPSRTAPAPAGSGAAGTAREQDASTPGADDDLVTTVVADLAAARALAERTVRRHPGLRSALRPVAGLHTTHLDLLGGAPADDGPRDDSPVAPGAGAALLGVRRGEERLVRRLTTWAVAAESGELAQALAAMAAGTAQRLAVLPATPPRGGAA